MSTPYWGQLPGPKVAQAGHARRRSESDDYTYNADRRSSFDVPPVRRSNRASIQTQNTEAPSESTFSPHDSPSASSFAPQGLAPRPPSYRQGPGEPSDSRRPRRPSRQQDEEDEDGDLSPILPAAPEVPRGPPVSYRHPYGNGGLPYTYTAAGAPAPPQPYGGASLQPDDMDNDDYQKSSQRAREYQQSDRAQADLARRDSSASAYDQISRRATTGGSSGRHKKYLADDRSPLQRLELTLDSITKEEKRARVEAAERRARERQALRAGKQPAVQQPRTHERKPSVAYGERRPSAAAAPIAVAQRPAHREVSREVPREIHREAPREAPRDIPRDAPRDYSREIPQEAPREAPRETYREPPPEVPVQKESSSRHRGPLTQHPPEEAQHYSSGALLEPEEVHPAPRHAKLDSGIPKRNLSFRERAARDHVALPEAAQPPASSGGFSLTRSGSNKLKKQPPADHTYHRRVASEAHAAPVVAPVLKHQPPTHDDEDDYYEPEDIVPVTRQPTSRYRRDKDLPPNPPEARRPSMDVRPDRHHIPMPGDDQRIRRRVTEPIPRAEYASDEEYAPPPTRSKTVSKKEVDDGAHAENQAAARRKHERADSDYSDDDSHSHKISNMIFKPREEMAPGDGLYLPPQWLDEWKKGTVGSLAGPLLEIKDVAHVSEPDVNKAWWEQDNRTKSHGYAARPRKAEAFDGEYDENGEFTYFLVTE